MLLPATAIPAERTLGLLSLLLLAALLTVLMCTAILVLTVRRRHRLLREAQRHARSKEPTLAVDPWQEAGRRQGRSEDDPKTSN